MSKAKQLDRDCQEFFRQSSLKQRDKLKKLFLGFSSSTFGKNSKALNEELSGAIAEKLK